VSNENAKVVSKPHDNKELCLTARNISKQYPGTLALDNVNFKAQMGKVNVLVGENGAGKSTLMKLIAGIEQPSRGVLYLGEQELKLKSTADAAEYGIGIVHQELNLLPNLNIYQNIFMAKESKKHGVIDNQAHIEKAKTILAKLEHPLDPNMLVRELRVGQQQIIEIAKTMAQQDVKILIMDEPTSSLSNDEVEVLFKIIEELKSQGVCIIYISHRMDEVMRIGDNITVLRDGRLVEQRDMVGVDLTWIVESMVGRRQDYKARKYNKKETPIVLEVENLTLPNNIGGYHFKDVSFKLQQGKILGVYGMLGSGRTELLETLMGLHPRYAGKIHLNGKEIVPKGIYGQIKNGFALVPEDRQREGLVQSMNIAENMTLSSLKNNKRKGLLSNITLQNNIKRTITDLRIKVANAKLPILSLSGGNQQKVVIGKGLLTDPKVLLLDEPSRGIDVGAKADVFAIIEQCATKGLAIIAVSSEMKEIIAISDEILILRDGKMSGHLTGEEISGEGLMGYATAKKALSTVDREDR